MKRVLTQGFGPGKTLGWGSFYSHMDQMLRDYKTHKQWDLADPRSMRAKPFRSLPFIVTVKSISHTAADKAAMAIKSKLSEMGASVRGPIRKPRTYGLWSQLGQGGNALTKRTKPFRIYRVEIHVHRVDYRAIDALHWMNIHQSCVIEISMMNNVLVDREAERREKQKKRWVARQERKAAKAKAAESEEAEDGSCRA